MRTQSSTPSHPRVALATIDPVAAPAELDDLTLRPAGAACRVTWRSSAAAGRPYGRPRSRFLAVCAAGARTRTATSPTSR